MTEPVKPEISARGRRIPSSPIRKLAPLATEAEKKGVKIYRLNIGQPDLPSPTVALDAVRSISRTTLEYSPSQGFESLRKKFSLYYSKFGINLSEDDIVITTGGSEAILFALMSVLDPGDEIIITEPVYANNITFALEAGVVVRTVTTRIEDGFRLPGIDSFEALVNERTKAILICNPGNPTGCVYTREEMLVLRDFVRRRGLFLISDEVYREYIYSDAPYTSALHLKGIEDNVIVIDSVSKRYSECGIRVGALVTRNVELRKTVHKLCQARLSPPLLGQIVAEASIEGTEDYSRAMYAEYLKRRSCLVDGVNAIEGCYAPMPGGAFYAVVQLPVDDAELFCAWCLESFCWKDGETPQGFSGETVMMAPAAGFYVNRDIGRCQARLAYVLCCEDIRRALFILEKALKQYKLR